VAPAALAAALLACALAVAPWYTGIGDDLGRWRITAGWLDGRPAAAALARAPLELLASYFAPVAPSGRTPPDGPVARLALVGLLAVAAGAAAGRGRILLLGWAAAACLGPVLFDLVQATRVSTVPRYALAGLPAAILLAALAAARLGRRAALAVPLAAALLWAPSLLAELRSDHRGDEPFGWVATELARRPEAHDLVVLQSVPAAAAALARELPPSTPVLVWTERLRDERSVAELARACRDRDRVLVAWIHGGYERGRALEWLDTAGRKRDERRPASGRAVVLVYDLAIGPTAP
jgi:hypothetical protein